MSVCLVGSSSSVARNGLVPIAHTIKYDSNIVLRVDGGKLVVENLLRSDG